MTESLVPVRKVYQVSELAQALNQVLESEFKEVWVQGEISGFRKYKTGHYYFALKDEKAKISAVMFRFQTLYLKFMPEDGLSVLVRGGLNFYPPRGELTLIVDAMEPVGIGALQLAFEQLKAKLSAEGLFNPERKKPIPSFLRRIAVITSPTGAVFYDLLKVFRQKKTKLEILLIPSRVQGEGAEFELAEAIKLANLPALANPPDRLPLELIILARGGGSVEDLWPFNTEHLARAIAQSKIPIMSAIGHEVDYTISDLVADARAPTPTAAAEKIAQSQEEMIKRLNNAEQNLTRRVLEQMEQTQDLINDFIRGLTRFKSELFQLDQRVVILSQELGEALRRKISQMAEDWTKLSHLFYQFSPSRWLSEQELRLAQISSRLQAQLQNRISEDREQISRLSGSLQALSPLSTLSRGYAIAQRKLDQKIVKDQKEVELGELMEIILHRGELSVRVSEKKEKNRWEDDGEETGKNQRKKFS